MLIPVISVNKSSKTKLIRISYSLQYCLILTYLIELSLNLILQHGDIEAKPGPRGKYSQYFSFCHWNLNSLPAHSYAKVSLLQSFNTLHKFDLICLSETYLDSSISTLRRSLLLSMVINHFVLTIPLVPKEVEYVYIHKESISVKVLNLSQLS